MVPKAIFLSLFILSISTLSFIEAINDRFTIDLIHRDSSISPFYNPLETDSDRLKNALRRSIARVNHFNPTSISPDQIQASVISNGGEYLMKISIGTPPVEVLAIADTGSDLTWTQCKPCIECYNQTAPLFDPSKSSTYRDLSCESKFCAAIARRSCNKGKCKYGYGYGDRSFTIGNLAIESFTFGSSTRRSVKIPKIVFGCGHNNDGTFNARGSGLVGLGGGPLSLITQLGSTIGGKFSYCLVPFSSNKTSSKMRFGSEGVVSGEGVVTTPRISASPSTFYYLTLEGISVGNKRLTYKSSSSSMAMARDGSDVKGGNLIIIDSGTTLTMIPRGLYDDVEAEVKKAIPYDPTPDPQGDLSLCYMADSDFKIPTITAHFTDADLVMHGLNTFVRISEDLVCFVMIPSDSISIFGNLSQMNMLVGYDLENGTVSFKHTDCTKY